MELGRDLIARFIEATLQAHLDGELTFEEAREQLAHAFAMAARGDKGLEGFMRACLET